MDVLIDIIRREVAMAFAQRQTKGTLVATGYDPDRHMVRGMIMPHGVESGWMRLGAIAVGDGHGIVVGPKVGDPKKLDGDQFDIVFENGDPNTPMAAHRSHSVKSNPPRVESGEMLFKHEKGAKLFMGKDGAADFSHGKGGAFAFDKDGNASVNTKNMNLSVDAGSGSASFKAQSHSFDGDVSVRGSVKATGSVTGSTGAPGNGMALTPR